jgi:hypothetical protein
MLAAPQRSPVELILGLLSGLGLPSLNWHTVLLLDTAPVPLGDDVEAAERDDPLVRIDVVNVAALHALDIIEEFILKVHHSNQHRFVVKRTN